MSSLVLCLVAAVIFFAMFFLSSGLTGLMASTIDHFQFTKKFGKTHLLLLFSHLFLLAVLCGAFAMVIQGI